MLHVSRMTVNTHTLQTALV